MELIIIIILINILTVGLCSFAYYYYDITAPLFMSLIIFLLSIGILFAKNETYYKTECLICNKITYSNESESIKICDECKEIVKKLKEREEK